MNFLGDCSHYVELPKPDEIYDYDKYTNAAYLLNTEKDQPETFVSNNLDNSINDFNFTL